MNNNKNNINNQQDRVNIAREITRKKNVLPFGNKFNCKYLMKPETLQACGWKSNRNEKHSEIYAIKPNAINPALSHIHTWK